MIDLRQNQEPQPNWKEKLWADFRAFLKAQTPIRLSMMVLGAIMGIIIFIGGVPLMVSEVVANFPIPSFLYIPIGTLLMLVLVLIAKQLTQELADVLFTHSKYSNIYRAMLFIVTLLCLFFTWSVQSEATDLQTDTHLEAELSSMKLDSANLKTIDMSLTSAGAELAEANATLLQYNATKATRKGGWISEAETALMSQAREIKTRALAQQASLTERRIAETERLQSLREQKENQLRIEKEKALNKGRGKAGLAELILVVVAFFLAAYKNRFKKQKVEEQELIQEFPKGLSIEDRERMIAEVKPLAFDEENQQLLIELSGQRFYHDIPKVVKSASSCHSRLDSAKSESSRDTQLRNIHYCERLLAMTPLQPEDYKRIFSYVPMFPDYWNSASGNVVQHVSETPQKRPETASQRIATPDIDLFP